MIVLVSVSDVEAGEQPGADDDALTLAEKSNWLSLDE